MTKSWDAADYPFRIEIAVQAANIDGNLADFPCLLKLTDTQAIDKDKIASKRYRIFDHNGTECAYEEQTYSEGASFANAEIWCKIADLYAAPAGDQNKLWLYYGYDGGDQSDAANAWDAGYKAVWHFEDSLADSSGNGETLTANGGPSYSASGKIGKCIDLESGSSQYLSHADGGSTDISGADQELTLEAWVKFESATADAGIISKYKSDTGDRQYILWFDHSEDSIACNLSGDGAANTRALGADNTVDDGSWHHVRAVYDDTDIRIYVDGALDANGADNPKAYTAGIADKAGDFRVGSQQVWGNYFDGLIDEVRVSDTDRSANWDKFQLANVNEADNELTWGTEEYQYPIAVVRSARRRQPIRRPRSWLTWPPYVEEEEEEETYQPLILRSTRRRQPIRRPRSRIVRPFWQVPLVPVVTGRPLARRVAQARRRVRSRTADPSTFRGRFYHDGRGLYRIFNSVEYRFYRDNSAPPAEDDAPFATNATLPHTPADVYADGTWYLSVSYFNGVIDSGFLPLGEHGETFLRLDLAGGEETTGPPQGPTDWRLELDAAGVVRVVGFYWESGALRADHWSIGYTTDGGDPPEDTPDVTVDLPAGLAVLDYALPEQANGTTVKVRLQTRRGDTVYSEDSTIKTATADAAGPTAPLDAQRWAGPLPEE